MKGEKSKPGLPRSVAPPEPPEPSPPPARAAAYIPPTEVPRESRYHTLDLKAVRLAPEIDPVRMKTQLSLRRAAMPSRQVWSPSVVVALSLAGVALGLGAWWSLQWWRDRPHVDQSLAVTEPQDTAAIVLAVPSAVLPQASAASAPSDHRVKGSSTQIVSNAASKAGRSSGGPGGSNLHTGKKGRKGHNTGASLSAPDVAVREPEAAAGRGRANAMTPAASPSQPELWLK